VLSHDIHEVDAPDERKSGIESKRPPMLGQREQSVIPALAVLWRKRHKTFEGFAAIFRDAQSRH
jgi:hypothetical protein